MNVHPRRKLIDFLCIITQSPHYADRLLQSPGGLIRSVASTDLVRILED